MCKRNQTLFHARKVLIFTILFHARKVLIFTILFAGTVTRAAKLQQVLDQDAESSFVSFVVGQWDLRLSSSPIVVGILRVGQSFRFKKNIESKSRIRRV